MPGGQGLGLTAISTSVLIASAATLLACPGLTVIRGVRIDGINAVTISTDVRDTRATLWLNATTGVPIQRTTESYDPKAPNQVSFSETVQYGFLSPTAANLRYLSAYVPPGFRNLPSASVP